MDKYLAIVNVEAGGGACGKLAGDAIAELRQAGVELDVWYTRYPGHAVELARAGLDLGYRDFVAVGGDGTAHEIVNGIAPAFVDPGDPEGPRVSLGFLPLGTGNSFIRDFTRSGKTGAIAGLCGGARRPCDVVRIRHDGGELYCINIFSFGFVADVCELTNARFKALGSGGYGIGVLAELAGLRFEPVWMRLDAGRPWQQRAALVSISNSQFTGGGMHIAPYAEVGDGWADVMVVGQLSRPVFVSLFMKMFKGQHVHHPAITTARAKVIELAFERAVPVMVDGEVARIRPSRVEVLPSALDVRM